jgi:DNA-binding NarL/FixJ family response regulator
MSTIKIAIVDDHQLFREGLGSLLTKSDAYQVVISASNGAEFLEKLSTGVRPEVVLLDLNMPEMDGFEVLKRMKGRYPEIKTLALSMHDDVTTLLNVFVWVPMAIF